MSKLNGKWNLVVKTYMGDQMSQVDYNVEGDTLTGTTTDVNSGNTAEIYDGRVEGDGFSYKVTLKIPVGELTFDMEGKLVGEELQGTSTNPMGTFDFVAVRA